MHQHPHYRGARRRREKGTEKIFEEIIAENFPNMGKEPLTQIQEVRVPHKINPRRNTLRYILIKLTQIKDKEKILKAAREKKQINIQGNPNIVISRYFQQKLCRPEGSGTIYL